MQTGKQTNGWHGAGTGLLKCPVPNCGHSAKIITKVHCRLEHGLERDEVEKRYGMPSKVMSKQPFKGGN